MKKLINIGLGIIITALLPTLNAANVAQANQAAATVNQNKHVLFIGLDGCRADAFKKALQEIKDAKQDPDFVALVDGAATDYNIYAGGHVYDATQQITKSEPGWTTILTGVWANQHHIVKNGDIDAGDFNHAYPTLFNYVKHFLPNTTVVALTDWSPIKVLADYRKFGNDSADVSQYFPYKGLANLVTVDQALSAEAAKQILTNAPSFIYTHFDNPDENGHHFTFSVHDPRYIDAIKHDDADIDIMAKAIAASRQQGNEWLVIISTDHGGHFFVHGSERWTDRDIFAVLNDPKSPEFSAGKSIQAEQGQTTFVPTILNYLGLSRSDYPTVYGAPLGSASIAALNIKYDIALDHAEDGYPRVVDQQNFPGLEQYADKIVSVFHGYNLKNYLDKQYFIFLNDGNELKFDINQNKITQGPEPIAKDFPGLGPYVKDIVSVFYGHPAAKWVDPKYYIILNNGEYLSYDIRKQQLDFAAPMPIDTGFPGMGVYAKQIVSVAYGHPAALPLDEKYEVFLKDGNYLSFDINRHEITQGPIAIADKWPGLAAFATELQAVAFGHQKNNDLNAEYAVFLKPMPYR